MEILHMYGGSIGTDIDTNREVEPMLPVFIEPAEVDKQEDTLKRPIVNDDSDTVEPLLPNLDALIGGLSHDSK